MLLCTISILYGPILLLGCCWCDPLHHFYSIDNGVIPTLLFQLLLLGTCEYLFNYSHLYALSYEKKRKYIYLQFFLTQTKWKGKIEVCDKISYQCVESGNTKKNYYRMYYNGFRIWYLFLIYRCLLTALYSQQRVNWILY